MMTDVLRKEFIKLILPVEELDYLFHLVVAEQETPAKFSVDEIYVHTTDEARRATVYRSATGRMYEPA